MTGAIRIPRWLNEVLGDTPVKVSTTWDKSSKRLEKLALTVDPRVPDAAMLSAFTAFAGKRRSKQDMADMQAIHDMVVNHGANCPTYMSNHKEKKKMGTFAEKFKAFWTGLPDEEKAEFGEIDFSTSATSTAAPKKEEPNAEVEALKAKIAKMENDKLTGEATSYVDTLIRSSKLMPAQRDDAIFALFTAMQDDASSGSVTFTASDGTSTTTSRADKLKKVWDSQQPHDLLSIRKVPDGSVILSGSAPSTKTAYEEGLEYGKKYVEQEFRTNGSNSTNNGK